MKRKKLLIGAALAVLIGLIVLIPARTYAQSILRRLGGITLTTQEPFPKEEQEAIATVVAEWAASATAVAEQAADNENERTGDIVSPDPKAESTSNSNEAAATIEDSTYSTATPPPILNSEEIQNLAGFPGWQPKFVPEEYILHGLHVERDNFGNPIVRTSFQQENNDFFKFFSIDQWATIDNPREPIGNWNIGDAPVSNVIVNDEVAVFAEKAHIIPPPGANILIWTTNEYTFTMIASDLNQETMIAIAESMQAP